jgi:hypothetical protein
MLQIDPQLTFRGDTKASIMDIMSKNTPLSVFEKHVRELKPSNDIPRFTNGLATQVAIKDGTATEAYTEKLTKTMEYVNEQGNQPVLSQCVFIPFGRGATIDQNTFCSLIRMQNEFLHNVKHIEIHGLSDINVELHLVTDSDDGEDYANSIRELLLEECDIDGQHIVHLIKSMIKSDTSRAIFSKQNEILCNSILSDLENWLSSKFTESNNNIAFCKAAAVLVHTSTVDKRKSQNQVNYNAYASRIAKRFCSENPNGAVESYDTSPNRTPNRTPKRRINLTYADAAANATPMLEQSTTSTTTNASTLAPTCTQYTTSIVSNDNSSRLAELESIIQSIDSEHLSFQSEFKGLHAEFKKVMTSDLQHS